MSLSEKYHDGAFLISEGDGHFSRENITVASGQGKLTGGTVLTTTVGGTVTVTAAAGNTGTGVVTPDVTTPTVSGVQPGDYVIEIIEPGANAGVYQVTDPKGRIIGTGTVAGSAFNNQIKFTVTDATDFVSGDRVTYSVAASGAKWGIATASLPAYAVLLNAVDATSADAAGVAIVRLAEVNKNILTYDATVNDATKTAAKVSQLGAVGIIVR